MAVTRRRLVSFGKSDKKHWEQSRGTNYAGQKPLSLHDYSRPVSTTMALQTRTKDSTTSRMISFCRGRAGSTLSVSTSCIDHTFVDMRTQETLLKRFVISKSWCCWQWVPHSPWLSRFSPRPVMFNNTITGKFYALTLPELKYKWMYGQPKVEHWIQTAFIWWTYHSEITV